MSDEDLVGALCDIEEGLTEWEVNFVDSIEKWLRTHADLTDPQRAKAEQIWERFK